MVIHLDPQAADKFLGRFPIEDTVSKIFLVKGAQVNVKMSGSHCIPAVQLGDGAEVDKPVHLQGFMKGSWFSGRYPAADFSYFLQFRPAFS